MRKIHGFILCRETGEPLSNLVVAAFDSELSLQAVAAQINERSEVSPELWARFGRRLGSVLTDARGHFEFNDEMSHFSARAENPNLLVAVFAPEDVTSVERPFPMPPERRLLYISTMPRLEPGSEEAYVIRILRAQVERFGISHGTSTTPDGADSSSQRYVAVLQRAHDFGAQAKRLAQPMLKARLGTATDRIKAVKDSKLGELNALPPAIKDHKQRLKDRKDLPTLMTQTIQAGIARFSAAASPLDMTFSETELEALGLQASPDGTVRGTVNPAAIARLIAERNRGVDLTSRGRVAATPADVLRGAGKGNGTP